ncbi:asparaginase [Candidatus Chrysopegis kryptomonas]|uniref:asparaginase n=1 Tax=Candidatus Chryseopegocella kryptomonas TaxID=1633643 RepID=A0A0P1N0K1_9BACT|nr:asparaginase [Candidatus Chrysopegis kryptomonas]CUT01906.1 L-asparaginase [Candidatus Chrysopegis kryptomonas]
MKRILLIHTGGTFGMALKDGTLAPSSFIQRIIEFVPEVKQIAEIESHIVANIDSSNIGIEHWLKIADVIVQNYDDFDGFVITHGTDTMTYTASALSFILDGLSKPVILTGSQRPLSEIRTDARNNLINSVELATYPIPEVCIFFNNKLFRGNRTKKIDIWGFDAFDSPNYPPLAEVGVEVKVYEKNFLKRKNFKLNVSKNFSNEVFCVKIFPSVKVDFLMSLLELDIKGFVIEAFGSGNLPNIEERSLIPFVQKASEMGKIVAISTQAVYGKVDLTLYQCGKDALDAGALSCKDMTTETAIVKLMFLLAKYGDNVALIREEFYKPIAGEISED